MGGFSLRLPWWNIEFTEQELLLAIARRDHGTVTILQIGESSWDIIRTEDNIH